MRYEQGRADPTTELDEWRFINAHMLHADLGDNRHLITLSGTVKLGERLPGEGHRTQGFKGVSSDEWRHERLELVLNIPFEGLPWSQAGKGLLLFQFTPFITINAIYNAGESVNAGWAVDAFGLFQMQPTVGWHVNKAVGMWADLAVRDSDGTLFRIAYSLTALGRVEDMPAVPGPTH